MLEHAFSLSMFLALQFCMSMFADGDYADTHTQTWSFELHKSIQTFRMVWTLIYFLCDNSE